MRTVEELIEDVSEIADWAFMRVSAFPPYPGDMGTQMVRAMDSVGANLSEGTGRGRNSEKVKLQFFSYALGSAYEASYWLKRCMDRKYIQTTEGTIREMDLTKIVYELGLIFENG